MSGKREQGESTKVKRINREFVQNCETVSIGNTAVRRERRVDEDEVVTAVAGWWLVGRSGRDAF